MEQLILMEELTKTFYGLIYLNMMYYRSTHLFTLLWYNTKQGNYPICICLYIVNFLLELPEQGMFIWISSKDINQLKLLFRTLHLPSKHFYMINAWSNLLQQLLNIFYCKKVKNKFNGVTLTCICSDYTFY